MLHGGEQALGDVQIFGRKAVGQIAGKRVVAAVRQVDFQAACIGQLVEKLAAMSARGVVHNYIGDACCAALPCVRHRALLGVDGLPHAGGGAFLVRAEIEIALAVDGNRAHMKLRHGHDCQFGGFGQQR